MSRWNSLLVHLHQQAIDLLKAVDDKDIVKRIAPKAWALDSLKPQGLYLPLNEDTCHALKIKFNYIEDKEEAPSFHSIEHFIALYEKCLKEQARLQIKNKAAIEKAIQDKIALALATLDAVDRLITPQLIGLETRKPYLLFHFKTEPIKITALKAVRDNVNLVRQKLQDYEFPSDLYETEIIIESMGESLHNVVHTWCQNETVNSHSWLPSRVQNILLTVFTLGLGGNIATDTITTLKSLDFEIQTGFGNKM